MYISLVKYLTHTRVLKYFASSANSCEEFLNIQPIDFSPSHRYAQCTFNDTAFHLSFSAGYLIKHWFLKFLISIVLWSRAVIIFFQTYERSFNVLPCIALGIRMQICNELKYMIKNVENWCILFFLDSEQNISTLFGCSSLVYAQKKSYDTGRLHKNWQIIIR